MVFLKSIAPITIEDLPSKESIEFAAQFIVGLEDIRKQNQIPENGLDIKQFIGTDLFDPMIGDYNLLLSTLRIFANNLKGTTGFDDSVVDQVLLLTYFNACIDLRCFTGFISQPMQFIVGRKNIASTIVDYPKEVGAILIPFIVNRTTLIQWIKNNWESMDKQINENFTANPFIIKTHKTTELLSEIYDLKDNKNMSFPQIASELTDKYPDNPHVVSEEWIKRLYYYHKKIWKTLPKVTNLK